MPEPTTGPATEQGYGLGARPSIHHIALSVSDLDACVAWYESKLDFRVRFRIERPAMALIESGNVFIELMSVPDSEPNPDAFVPFTGSARIRGYVHGSISVDDVDESTAALRARGVEVVPHPYLGMLAGQLDGTPRQNMKLAWFWDIEGNLFQLWSGDVSSGEIAGITDELQ